MKKFLLNLLVGATVLAGCAPAGSAASPADATAAQGASNTSAGKIQVVTSIHAVDQIVKYIGGDRVETTRFVPPGVDPHDFEPTPKEMAALKDARILFINGLGMEPWVEDGGISGKTTLMVLGDGIEPIPLDAADSHGHGASDPHLWLGISELRIMAENAATALEMVSPEDKSYFQDNLQRFKAEADALEDEFQPRFAPYQGASFVTGHEAFGYLVRNIGLVQKGVSGPLAEGEPTPQKMKELVDFVKAEGIRTIFVEELGSPEVSQTLARDTGAELVVLPTLEASGEVFPALREIYEKVLTSLEK